MSDKQYEISKALANIRAINELERDGIFCEDDSVFYAELVGKALDEVFAVDRDPLTTDSHLWREIKQQGKAKGKQDA